MMTINKIEIVETIQVKDYQDYFLQAAKSIDHLEGSFVEMGFGAGTSARLWQELMITGYKGTKIKKRTMWLFDSFKGFPPPNPPFDGLYPKVGNLKASQDSADAFAERAKVPVEIIDGFFNDTISLYEGGPIAILHLDCDLYDSYKACLEGLYDKVVDGGLILFDEYKSEIQLRHYPGASRAIDKFFEDIGMQIVKAKFDDSKLREKFYIYKIRERK